MKKLTMMVVAVLCLGTAGLLWADAASDANKVNPQPLPPQGKQQVGGNNPTNSEDALSPQPYPPKGKGNKNAKIEHERKAGEKLTLHDQKQISGNLSGGGKTGKKGKIWTKSGRTEKGFYKERGFDKASKLKGATKGGTMDTIGGKAGITDGSSKDSSFMKYPGGPAGANKANMVPDAH